jgi:hypothetical protein
MARPLRVLIVVAVVAGFRIIEAQPGVPGTPTSLVVTVGGNLVSLEWSPPSIGGAISTYVIEAGSLSGSADLAAFATGGTATRFVTSAPPGLYFVRVRARNSVGMSGASNEAQVLVGGSCTLPPAPGTAIGQVVGPTVSVSWGAVSGASSYIVEAGSHPGAADLATIDTGTPASTLSATAPSGTYFVRIRGRNACGTGTPSNEITVTVGSPGFRDDFNGPSLDMSRWYIPEGQETFIPRTQMRPSSHPPTIVNGVLRLRVDTFNPTAQVPGDSFWGSEIVTRQLFDRGRGLIVRSRARVVRPAPAGLVASLFAYATRDGTRDEIDFELLTNTANAVLTNVFEDDPFLVAGRPVLVSPPGLDIGAFNDYELRWLPDRVEFLVNGVLVRQEFNRLPDDPLSIRLNFWAPDISFLEAFSLVLQPVASSASNQTFFYEVDMVEILQL